MRGGATQRSKPEEGAGELRREGGRGATQGGGSGRKARASCTEAGDGAAEQAESREGARAAARIAGYVGIKGWVFLQIDQRDEYFEPEGVHLCACFSGQLLQKLLPLSQNVRSYIMGRREYIIGVS